MWQLRFPWNKEEQEQVVDPFHSAHPLKGHWTIFWHFIFGWISFIMQNATANLQIQKEKFKNSFWKLRNHQFLLNILMGMRLICIHVAD